MSEEAALRALIRANSGAWFETCGRIWPKDRTHGLKKPRQNYLQRKIQRVVDHFEDLGLPVRILGLKPRARGSTTYFTALGYTLMRRISTSAIFIGGQSDQTVGLWNMMKVYHQNDQFDWGNTGTVNEKGASFSNGSRAKKETAKDVQAGIGDTYQLLHATEVARWSAFGVANAADVLVNLLKAVPLVPATYVFLESTAEGSSGPFHENWIQSKDAEDFLSGEVELKTGDYVRVFAAWFEFDDSAMRLTEEEKREIEKTLDSEEEFSGERELIEKYGWVDEDGVKHLGQSVLEYDVWEQLAWRRYAIRKECDRSRATFDRDYPHSWQTAFQKSGSMRFNQTGLSVLRKRMSDRVAEYGILENAKERRLAWRRTEMGEAKFTIFEKPITGCRYILSVDPMTGASQTTGLDPDKHGAFVLRAGYWAGNGAWVRPAAVSRVIPCRWDIDVLEDAVWKLARFYGAHSGCMIAIEMNMDRGLTELLKLRGANLYVREIFNQREQKTTGAFGFHTNERTRETLIDGLAGAIREWDTPGNGIDIFCPHAIEQLENFVVKPSGRSEAADGFHDDDVLAIALGLELIGHATTYSPERFGDNGLPPDLRPARQQPRPSGAYS